MALNTTFNPTTVDQYDKINLVFSSVGVSTTIPAGTTANMDLLLTDDMLFTGAWVVMDGCTLGDSFSLKVIDVSGTYAPAGTVLASPITNWYPPISCSESFKLVVPAKIKGGLTLRIIYTSTGASSPFIACNYRLHTILV